MTPAAVLKKQLEIAVKALDEIRSRRAFGPGVAEIALDRIKQVANSAKEAPRA